MRIAILTFDGFNEIDSMVALNVLNRVRHPGWQALLCGPAERATSMNGVTVSIQAPLEDASTADAVLVGSGIRTRSIVADEAMLARLRLDPSRQLIGAQCSGALLLARLGLLEATPACTDATTRPWLEAEGVRVLEQPFHAAGRVATAGGCLAAPYLAAWFIARLVDAPAAREALHYVAPVGEKDSFVDNVWRHVGPHVT